MDFDRLRAFVWTIEEGRISEAAKRLCRTQPAVTRMIQMLEDQVGAQLIDRRARPLQPTEAGVRMLKDANLILQAADRIASGVVRSGSGRPPLRLGVSRSLLWVLRGRAFVMRSGPLAGVEILVRSGWSPRLYRRFVRGELDAVVVLMPPGWRPDARCTCITLQPEPLVLIAPRRPGQPSDAVFDAAVHGHLQWILNPDGCGFRGALQRQLDAAGSPLRVQFELDAAPNEHLAMVAAGLGASIVPQSTLVEFPDLAGQVQRLHSDNPEFRLDMLLLWSADTTLPDAVRDSVAGVFGGRPSDMHSRHMPSEICSS